MASWLTASEAAKYLKVSRATIYNYCSQGLLLYYELESGGGRRFKQEDLDALLKPAKRPADPASQSGLP